MKLVSAWVIFFVLYIFSRPSCSAPFSLSAPRADTLMKTSVPIRINYSLTLHHFPALGTSCMISALGNVKLFSCLALVTCFPALGTRYMFSRAWHSLHVFPRLALVSCFPALGTLTCFPALGTRYMFSRAWHTLPIFSYAWHFLVLHVLYTEQNSQSQFLPDNEGEMWNSTCDPWTLHTWIHILALWEGGKWTEKQIVNL